MDLGHATNGTVDTAVSIDDGAALAAMATLKGITNSRDRDVVCFNHEGAVSN